MNKKFDRIVIGIAIIVFAITPAVYSLDIRVLWAVILDLGEISIVAMASVFAAFLSVLIAGFSLWLSMRADKRNEKQARILVRPLLTTINSTDENITDENGDDMLRVVFDVENCGVGTAIIKNFILEVNGKEIARNDIDKNQEFIEGSSTRLYFEKVGFMYPGSSIKAGGSQNLWIFEYKEGDVAGFIKGLNVRIEYQSIYEDEIFILNTNRFAD